MAVKLQACGGESMAVRDYRPPASDRPEGKVRKIDHTRRRNQKKQRYGQRYVQIISGPHFMLPLYSLFL